MKEELKRHGAKYVSADAQSSNEKQIADIESLTTRGADALIVLAWDSDAVLPGITKAEAEGIPVVGSNDGTTGGGVAALTAQGMEGIPVSGQEDDYAALNRVARGLHTVSVWKDAGELGKAAAGIAVALAKGTPADKIEGAIKRSGGLKDITMNAILLKPIPITRDNLDVVIDARSVTKEVVCRNVSKNPPPACK